MKKKMNKRRGGRKAGVWRLNLSPDVVREWRRQHKMSRATAANLVGVSTTTIQNWEVEGIVPSPLNQKRLRALMDAPAPVATREETLVAAADNLGRALAMFIRLLVSKR